MIFSILICHINERQEKLKKLYQRLVSQCLQSGDFVPDYDSMFNAFLHTEGSSFSDIGVEILVDADDKQLSTGEKRNNLLARATGRWCAFVDDDDMVSHDYVKNILVALNSEPDVVGIEGLLFYRGNPGKLFVHSLAVKSWFEKDSVYYRNPNHLNPIKRELAIKAGFPDATMGEDHEFSKKILPLLKSEVFLLGPVYHYLK